MEYILPASPNWYCSRIVDCDSRGIACVGCKNAVYVWNVSSQPPKFMSFITAHRDRVIGLSLCPVDAGGLGVLWCCSAGEDRKVKILDIDKKSCLKEHEQHQSKPTCVHWSSADRDLIASGDEKGTVVVWNVSSGETWNWQPDFSNCHIFCLAFSPKASSLLAVGFKSGNVAIVNVNKKNPHTVQRLRGHEDEIHSIAWRHCSEDPSDAEDKQLFGNETLVATSSRDKTIRIWNSQSGQTVKVLTLPNGFANIRREETGVKPRIWVTLAWPPNSPMEILSSGLHGELIVWNISQTGRGQFHVLNPGSSHKGHNRIVFSIASGGQDFKTLVSVSMDRQIIVWDLQKQSVRMNIPTLGGFVYAIDRSEIQPDRLAIGAGDSLLRVCNIDQASSSFDVQTFWQGIKAKVTAVSWHPVTEGLLAFGTEDGKVGIYDVHSTRPPLISSTYHKKVVFDICWARPCGGVVATDCSLYSVGDGFIYQHRPSKLDQPAEDVNVIIEKTNGYQRSSLGRSCMAWGVDSRYLSLGNEDGSIDVYEAPDLQHLCKIQVQRKLITCLKWHPSLDRFNPSPLQYWLASSSKDSTIHVFNLWKIVERCVGDDKIPEVAFITESFCQLEGHSSQVTQLYWNPHEEGLLASASYDWTVQVWDVKRGCPLKNYRGHHGHVLSLLWDETDPDVIFSGADDYTVQGWRISKQTHTTPPSGYEKRKKTRLKNKGNDASTDQNLPSKTEVSGSASSLSISVDDSSSPLLVDTASVVTANKTTVANEEIDHEELLRRIEQKRIEIVEASLASATGIKEDENDIGDDSDEGDDIPALEFSGKPQLSGGSSVVKDSNAKKDRKKRRAKSLFPKSSAADNRGKQPTQQDCIDFARFKYSGTETNLDLDHFHLGCFIDRRNTYSLFQQEELYHLEHENYEQHLTLHVFKGNVKEAIRVAADNGQLNDHLMAMAPLVSATCWRDLCLQYAKQLVKEGLFHKASTYYLSANKVYEAINMLKENKLFKDAVCLAKVRLSPFDPALRDLYITWGNHLAKDGNYELAAKCYLAADNPQEAVNCLSRRPELSALRAAALVSVAADELEAARVYAQKFVQENILACDWIGAAEIVKAHTSFMVLALPLSVHEVLVRQLTSLNLLTDPLPDKDCQDIMPSESNPSEKISGFLVDMEKEDPLCIWKPLLVGKESFLLYILRIWHEVWNVVLSDSNVTDLYNQLVSLHDAKQNQAGERQMLLEASLNISLCILKMVLQDYEGSAKWMAAVINLCRDRNQLRMRRAFLRLLLPQGPLYFRHLGQQLLAFRMALLDDKGRSAQLMQTSVVSDSKASMSDCSGDESFGTENDNGGHGFAINTSTWQCTQLDLLVALYCFTVLEFLISEQTATDRSHDSKSSENAKSCPDGIDDSEVMLNKVNCRYFAHLAEKLLWDVEVQRYKLLESEFHIKKALASLVATHKASNRSDSCVDQALCVSSAQQMEPDFSPSKVLKNTNVRPSVDCQKPDSDCLTVSSIGRKSLPSDMVQIPQTSGKKSLATLDEFSETDAIRSADEHVAMKEKTECTSARTEGSRADPYLVDADVVCKTMQPEFCEESVISSVFRKFDEIPEVAQPTKEVEASDIEFQSSFDSCRYEDIPAEWYSFAVDEKYHLPYVTLSVLQKECSRIQAELSQMPCVENFPHPLMSARFLLSLIADYSCQKGKESICSDLAELSKRLRHWGLRFAYTSDWIQIFSSPPRLTSD